MNINIYADGLNRDVVKSLDDCGFGRDNELTNQNYDDLKVIVTKLAANGLSFEVFNKIQSMNIYVFKE